MRMRGATHAEVGAAFGASPAAVTRVLSGQGGGEALSREVEYAAASEPSGNATVLTPATDANVEALRNGTFKSTKRRH